MSKFNLYGDGKIEKKQLGTVCGTIKTLGDFKNICSKFDGRDEIWFADACGENVLSKKFRSVQVNDSAWRMIFTLYRNLRAIERIENGKLTMNDIIRMDVIMEYEVGLDSGIEIITGFDYVYCNGGYLGTRLVLSKLS